MNNQNINKQVDFDIFKKSQVKSTRKFIPFDLKIFKLAVKSNALFL